MYIYTSSYVWCVVNALELVHLSDRIISQVSPSAGVRLDVTIIMFYDKRTNICVNGSGQSIECTIGYFVNDVMNC